MHINLDERGEIVGMRMGMRMGMRIVMRIVMRMDMRMGITPGNLLLVLFCIPSRFGSDQGLMQIRPIIDSDTTPRNARSNDMRTGKRQKRQRADNSTP